MKHNQKRWIAAAMSLALTLSCVEPVFASSPVVPVSDGRTPAYDEAYYATLDYYGNLTEGSIVKSYVLNGAASITDYGEYESVSNLTNGVVPTQNGKCVAFDFSGEATAPTHFYFQGKTAQPYRDLPWKLSVSYKLNGVPMKAEELAGKTGVVEINVDAVPNKNASDYARHNYTLESMALFNQDDILSLEAPGAQVQLLGNIRAVLFVALPGEEGHYTIRVGADKFEFGGMTFLMVPATLSQLSEISKLAQRKQELETNYEKLSGSLNTLLDSLDSVSGSLYSSAGGLDALNAARGTVSSGKGGVYTAADRALSDLDAMASTLAPLGEDLGAATRSIGVANDMLAEMSTDAAELRADLSRLDGILTNAQGSKDDLLAVMTDVSRLQTKLDYAAGSLGGIGAPEFSVSPEQLASAKALFDAYAAATSGGSGMTESRFIGVALRAAGKDEETVKLLTSVSSADAAGEAAYRAAYDAAYAAARPIAYNAAYIAAYKAVLDSQQLTILYQDDASQTADAFKAAMEAKLDYLAAAGKLKPEQAGQLKLAADAKAKEVAEAKGEEIAQAKAEEIASAKKQEAAAGYAALDSAYQAGLAAGQAKDAGTLDFAGYLTALAAASDDKTQKDGINRLLAMYREDPETVSQMMANPGALADINQDLAGVNAALRSVGSTGAAAGTFLASLSELCGDIAALRPLVESADDLTELTRTDAEKVEAALASAEELRAELESYQGDLDRTAAEVQKAGNELAATSADTSAYLRAAEDLLRKAGPQFDAATRDSLTSLAAALRGTAAALGSGSDVRSAKESIEEVIEDAWNDYTGDVNDLLEIDANAAAESLTDARNSSPTSVQVIVRTQEIKAAAAQTQASAQAAEAAEGSESTGTTLFERIEAMFSNLWGAIVGLFRR